MRTLQRRIINTTQMINTLSYACNDTNHLQAMLNKLEELMALFKSGLPSDEGLPLRPLSLLKRARQIKQKYRSLAKRASTYSTLESQSYAKPGRKKGKFTYRNRVGRKAQHFRKVHVHRSMLSSYLLMLQHTCISILC